MSSIRRTKRGNEATVDGFTLLDGEPAFDNTNKRFRMGDGSTTGGVPHANYIDLQHDRMNYVAVTGTNTLTGNLSPAPDSVAAGMRVHIKTANTNTGAVTFNPNSLGAANVKKKDTTTGNLVALAAGDLIAGGIYALIYDGTQWQVTGSDSGSLTSVSQGDLNTSVGSVFYNTSDEQHYTLAGGSYGFYPTINVPNTANIPDIQMMDSTNSVSGITTGSDVSMISLNRVDGLGGGISIKQRYITSSPPFDMGDGDVNGFIFLHVNKAKDILNAWAADVPPWAYNGPTNIRANRICPKTGAKMRRVLTQRTMKDILNDVPPKDDYEAITQKMKNADMRLIRHPFGKIKSGEHVLLLDPMDPRIEYLIRYQNEGEDIRDLFDVLKFDNERLKRKGPAGVKQVRFSA